jgi:hypothetical protein
VVDNVLEHPSLLRYRRLSATNKSFRQKIGDHEGALAVLVAAGFELQSMGSSLQLWVLPASAVDVGRLRQIRSEMDLGLNALDRLQASSQRAGDAMSTMSSVAETDPSESSSPGMGAASATPAGFVRQISPPYAGAPSLACNEPVLRLMQLQLRARSVVMGVHDEAEKIKRLEDRRKVGTRLKTAVVLCAAVLLLGFGAHLYGDGGHHKEAAQAAHE